MMNSILQTYLVPAALAGFLLWRYLRLRRVKSQLPDLLQAGAVVVDVRTAAEFQAGARPGSLNIPLDQLEAGAARLDPTRGVIVCCASGTRSALAATLLRRRGFTQVVNAGPWTNTMISKTL
jgi:rhodanese-related sulfurtransferase